MTEAIARNLVSQAAFVLNVPLSLDHLPGVAANFLQLAKMADLLAEFSYPPGSEPAPVFEP